MTDARVVGIFLVAVGTRGALFYPILDAGSAKQLVGAVRALHGHPTLSCDMVADAAGDCVFDWLYAVASYDPTFSDGVVGSIH